MNKRQIKIAILIYKTNKIYYKNWNKPDYIDSAGFSQKS